MAVYKIGASGGELQKNRFEFEFGGEKLSLPKFEFMPVAGEEWIGEHLGQNISQRVYVLGLVKALDAEIGRKLDEANLARDQINDFYMAWLGASKVDEGKS